MKAEGAHLVVPSSGTRLAVAENLHPPTGDTEAMFTGQSLVDGSAMTTLELDDFSAAEADQMLMLVRLSFIAGMIAGQLKLANQVQILEKLQRSIDGGQAEAGHLSPSELVYLVGAQMPWVLPYDSHDGPSLGRDSAAPLPK